MKYNKINQNIKVLNQKIADYEEKLKENDKQTSNYNCS